MWTYIDNSEWRQVEDVTVTSVSSLIGQYPSPIWKESSLLSSLTTLKALFECSIFPLSHFHSSLTSAFTPPFLTDICFYISKYSIDLILHFTSVPVSRIATNDVPLFKFPRTLKEKSAHMWNYYKCHLLTSLRPSLRLQSSQVWLPITCAHLRSQFPLSKLLVCLEGINTSHSVSHITNDHLPTLVITPLFLLLAPRTELETKILEIWEKDPSAADTQMLGDILNAIDTNLYGIGYVNPILS